MDVVAVSLFPDLYTQFLATSLVQRAIQRELVQIKVDSLLSFCAPKERVDAPSFGHGSGMLIRPEVVERAVAAYEANGRSYFRVFFSPHGKKLDQPLLKDIYKKVLTGPVGKGMGYDGLMLLPARYEGMDARVEEFFADEIISLGDYVLMGGDLPAMVFLEGLLRLVPGVVGREDSVANDSFSGAFVDYPEYTEPVSWRGMMVPEAVRSGNHKALREWRTKESAQRTVSRHFQWLSEHVRVEEDIIRASAHIPSHYAVIMHTQVMLPGDRVGETSITSFDIHDIARSAKTYGLSGYFIVSPLKDQQEIAKTILDFWKTGVGVSYNPHRHEAVASVDCMESLQSVIEEIKKREGVAPLIIATSAIDKGARAEKVSFFDQARVWQENRPVLFLFGTGRGLAQEVMDQADFVLPPIRGFSAYNHLSVRSAAAIIFDRWLGIKNTYETIINK